MSSFLAAATQEDVFRSIEQNVGQTANFMNILLLLLAGAVLIFVLVLIGKRRKAQAMPRAINNQGLLIKEIAKTLEIKPADLKRIKALAQVAREKQGVEISNPLTLMLCPSLLAKAMQDESE